VTLVITLFLPNVRDVAKQSLMYAAMLKALTARKCTKESLN